MTVSLELWLLLLALLLVTLGIRAMSEVSAATATVADAQINVVATD